MQHVDSKLMQIAHLLQWKTKKTRSPTYTALDFMAVHVQVTMKPAKKRDYYYVTLFIANVWLHVSS